MLMPGAILGVRIMKQVVGQRAPNVMLSDHGSGHLLAITSHPRVLLCWTLQKYPLQVQLQKHPTGLTARWSPAASLRLTCLLSPSCNCCCGGLLCMFANTCIH